MHSLRKHVNKPGWKVNVAATDLNDDADDALYGHDDDRQAAVLGGHPGPVPEQQVGL